MAKNKRPAKRYRPPAVLTDTVRYVLSGFAKPNPEHVRNLKIRHHGAMREMVLRRADNDDFNILLAAVSMAQELSFGDPGDTIVAALALEALNACRERAMSAYLLDEDEIEDINEALALHDTQLDTSTVGEIQDAEEAVHKRVLGGHFTFALEPLKHAA